MPNFKSPLYKFFGLSFDEHGGYDTPIDTSKTVAFDVIGVGLPRTGTTSLAVALEMLGVGPVFQPIDLVRQPAFREAFIDTFEHITDGRWKAGDPALNARLQRLFAGYRSSTDLPPSYFVREMYSAFPNAKYILGLRRTSGSRQNNTGASDSAKMWWESMWNANRPAISRGWYRTFHQIMTYPVTWIYRTDVMVQLGRNIQRQQLGGQSGVEMGAVLYDRHYEHVKKLIPPEQVLEFDVRDGWEPLCRFLDVPVPKEPFPKKNEREKMQAMWTAFQMYGLFIWCCYIGAAAGAVWLAMRPEAGKHLVSRVAERFAGLLSKLG